MIHKFLVVDKTIFLSSAKLDDEKTGTTIIELLVPINVHWNIVKLIEEANYLLASHEQMAMVQTIYRRVYKEAAPYAVFEADRLWLFKHAA